MVAGTDPDALLADTGRMFSVEQLDERWPMAARILADFDSAGVDVHQVAKEYGPGQYEISLLPTDPLAAADRFLLARQLIRAAARAEGATASFMPKPYTDLPGNGLHVHLGLTRADDPSIDLVADPDDPERLAPAAGPAIAGLLAHAIGQRDSPRRRRTPTSACCRGHGRRRTCRGRSAIAQRSSACRDGAWGDI